MIHFAARNLLLFFKDKTTMLLSFLAEFIVVGLYILFLRNNLLDSFSGIPNIGLLMDLWMIAGILGITSFTATMGAYGIMVEDKGKRIYRDFAASPAPRLSLLGGYLLGTVIIGFLLSVFLFLSARVYLLHCHGVKLAGETVGYAYGLLFLVAFSNSSMALLMVSFVKSGNALAFLCTIAGSLIGFLTGIYLPPGSLPQQVRWVVTCFPVSHNVVLFRRLLLEPLLAKSFGEGGKVAALEFMEYMGVQYSIGGKEISFGKSLMIICGTAMICLLLTFIKEGKEAH